MVCCKTELSDLSINSYADFLMSRGESVFELGGACWMEYHGALIPAVTMPVYFDFSYDEAFQLVKKSRSLFLRYATHTMKPLTNWWDIVCRHYDFNTVSSNTRSKVRRGVRRLTIKQVSPDWLSKQGYECHVNCYKRYKHASPKNRKTFESFLYSLRDQSIFDIWACFKNEKLLGYILCVVENNGVFMHTIDITPEGLHDYAAYAMIHHMLEHYVNEKRLPVSNGSRSIAHATDMQDFLCKFGFEREYSELHVIYRPDIKFMVSLLYPFRNSLKFFGRIPFVNNMSSVLYQEEIVRRQTICQPAHE